MFKYRAVIPTKAKKTLPYINILSCNTLACRREERAQFSNRACIHLCLHNMHFLPLIYRGVSPVLAAVIVALTNRQFYFANSR